MKIGIVTTWFERGAAYVSKEYKHVLESFGCEVKIYARGGELYAKNNPEWDSPAVYWSKRRYFPFYNYTDSKELVSWAKVNEIDVVIFNEQVWLANVLALRDSGVKVGAYIDYYKQDMLELFNAYDFLLCNTKRHFDLFSKHHNNAIYIPWGTDTELFNTSTLRTTNSKVRFFHSAGMTGYRKGTDLAIKAFLGLPDEYLEQAQLIVHSQQDFSGLFSSAENKKIIRLVESGSLSIINKTVTAPGLYHQGDIYVYPSRLEGIGLTIAEAISCGMPVIVPDVQPMNEFVTKDSYKVKIGEFFSRSDGYYWPQNEVEIKDLENAYKYFIDNKKQIPVMQSNAREEAINKYDFKSNCASLKEILESVANQPVAEISPDSRLSWDAYFDRRIPFVTKIPEVYSALYDSFRIITKNK